jgi:hypothetical protein
MERCREVVNRQRSLLDARRQLRMIELPSRTGALRCKDEEADKRGQLAGSPVDG